MTDAQQAIFAMLCMTTVNTAGTLALKHYAGSDRDLFFVLGTAAYILGAAFYVLLLREQPLAVLATITTLMQLGLMTALSVWFYGEQVSPVQWLGLGTGFTGLAIVMIAALV